MSNSSSTWIIIGVLVVLVVWIIMIYNGLVAMRQRVNQSFADIDVQLKQRHDLIPNLVETVKGYATHERGTLEAVIKARQTAVAAPSIDQKVQAENMLAAARRFFNNAVQEYNTGIQNFPAVLIAGPLGFREHAFFDLGETRAQVEQAPQVKF